MSMFMNKNLQCSHFDILYRNKTIMIQNKMSYLSSLTTSLSLVYYNLQHPIYYNKMILLLNVVKPHHDYFSSQSPFFGVSRERERGGRPRKQFRIHVFKRDPYSFFIPSSFFLFFILCSYVYETFNPLSGVTNFG